VEIVRDCINSGGNRERTNWKLEDEIYEMEIWFQEASRVSFDLHSSVNIALFQLLMV
jgi:hypothetical protein